jgi:hypothetical protein
MRLSGLLVASILLGSAMVLAQHSGGGGGGHSGGASSSGSSGGSVEHSAGGHSSSSSTSQSPSSAGAVSAVSSRSQSSRRSFFEERKGGPSFFHPFRRARTVQLAGLFLPPPCLKGRCGVCPPGESRNGAGRCGVVSNACAYGNGFGCSAPLWFSGCRFLADQLSAQQQLMFGRDDAGANLRYQELQDEYQRCLQRYGLELFSGYIFTDALPLDMP